MVNTSAFAKRLQKLMEYYELSAATFADKIEVGRSSISHIVSGRNKPSLDFIMKILRVFPDVNLYWLMNGSGPFIRQASTGSSRTNSNDATKGTTSPPTPLLHSTTDSNKRSQEPRLSDNRREIKKVIVLYNDGSFESFENG